MDKDKEEIKLVRYLLERSYYHNMLKVDEHSILSIIKYNHQLSAVFSTLHSATQFKPSIQLDLQQFKNEHHIIESFFEYLFYASPVFVKRAAYGEQ